MQPGQLLPAEHEHFADEATGRRVCRLTSHPSQHHHNFYYVPSYTPDSAHRFFVSHRNGFPALFMSEVASGALMQCTARTDINEWSVFPGHQGHFVVYTAGAGGYRLDLETLEETEIVHFESVATPSSARVSGGLGPTAVSHDDRWWAVRVKTEAGWALVVVDLASGAAETILESPSIGQMQFCPSDSGLLHYGGDPREKIWLIGRDGSGNRLLYRQEPMQWVAHEIWLPGAMELAFIDWPNGVRAVDAVSGEVRSIADFNVWHATPSPDGRRMIADTNHPDIGLHLLSTCGEVEASLLCESKASSQGDHWAKPFPYSKGHVSTYSPPHTHPHPSFSPDGRRVIFTSDRTGQSQVYEVELDP